MRLFLAFLLIAAGFPAAGEIYKQVAEDGTVTYSDRPLDDSAQPVKLKPISVVESDYKKRERSQSDQDPISEDDDNFSYSRVAISSPTHEQTLQNVDQVNVVLSVEPPLRPEHQITYLFDGVPLIDTRESQVNVTDLERGEHSLGAVIRDSSGRTVAQAEPVVFFVRQNSIIRPANPTNQAPRANQVNSAGSGNFR